MLFLGLLDSLGLSSGVSTDGLRNLSLDIDAHALGDTLGNIVGDVLDDGSAGHTVLGGHSGGGVGQVGGAHEELGRRTAGREACRRTAGRWGARHIHAYGTHIHQYATHMWMGHT